MNLDELAELAIGRLKEDGFYSEVSEAKLFHECRTFLGQKFKTELKIVEEKIKIDPQYATQDNYRKEHKKIENLMILYASCFAATTKEELQSLVNPG